MKMMMERQKPSVNIVLKYLLGKPKEQNRVPVGRIAYTVV